MLIREHIRKKTALYTETQKGRMMRTERRYHDAFSFSSAGDSRSSLGTHHTGSRLHDPP